MSSNSSIQESSVHSKSLKDSKMTNFDIISTSTNSNVKTEKVDPRRHLRQRSQLDRLDNLIRNIRDFNQILGNHWNFTLSLLLFFFLYLSFLFFSFHIHLFILFSMSFIALIKCIEKLHDHKSLSYDKRKRVDKKNKNASAWEDKGKNK